MLLVSSCLCVLLSASFSHLPFVCSGILLVVRNLVYLHICTYVYMFVFRFLLVYGNPQSYNGGNTAIHNTHMSNKSLTLFEHGNNRTVHTVVSVISRKSLIILIKCECSDVLNSYRLWF